MAAPTVRQGNILRGSAPRIPSAVLVKTDNCLLGQLSPPFRIMAVIPGPSRSSADRLAMPEDKQASSLLASRSRSRPGQSRSKSGLTDKRTCSSLFEAAPGHACAPPAAPG
jgi:hypothetical protein